MKKRIVALILILCLIPGVFALASCGPKKPAKTEKPTEKVTEVTTDRWEVYGPEIKAALDEESKSFKIELAEFNQVEKASRNQKYLAGPDKREGADSIGQQIYEGVVLSDNISNTAHIVGGLVGGVIGYLLNKKKAW